MSAFPRPFVAIIGGFWKIKDDAAKFAAAKKTASEFGSTLARAGMGLVVYFSNEESLEPHVVSGYVRELPADASGHLIRVRFAESQSGQVRFVEQNKRSELFEVKNFAGKDWEAPFYRSLVAADDVDAVFLMAGDRSTLIAGQIALARPLPVLAAGDFGGAAAKIRSELATKGDHPSSVTHTPEQSVAWLNEQLVERAKQEEQVRVEQEQQREQARVQQEQLQKQVHLLQSKYLKITSQKRRTFWAAGTFVALLVAVVFGWALVPSVKIYPILTILALVAAGATGALVRPVIPKMKEKKEDEKSDDEKNETDPWPSLVLGGIAGFVVGIAYLIPQLIGNPGPLKPDATVIDEKIKIQFISSVLVAISAGIGFDTVFNRLQKEAEERDVGPPASKTFAATAGTLGPPSN